jgi:hypothetical protein
MSEEKDSKETANYRYPKGSTEKICDNCSMFVEPEGCTSVEGYIDRLATCDYFEMMKDG